MRRRRRCWSGKRLRRRRNSGGASENDDASATGLEDGTPEYRSLTSANRAERIERSNTAARSDSAMTAMGRSRWKEWIRMRNSVGKTDGAHYRYFFFSTEFRMRI